MRRPWSVALVAVAIVGCSDVAGPGRPTGLSRFASILDDSAAVMMDSVLVQLPAATHWQLRHGGAAWWDSLATTSGTGAGWLRWQVDPTTLVPGVWVDTFSLLRSDSGPAIVFLDSLEIRTIPSQYITVKRPWRTGERDSAAAALANITFPIGVGLLPTVLDPNSVVVIVPNPLWHAAASRWPLIVQSPTDANMTMIGIDILEEDSTVSPPKKPIQWLMAYWYNTVDNTWKGYTVLFSTTATHGAITLNNTTWDASGGTSTSRGGGGQIHPATGEYWEATAGTFSITSNTACTATPTVLTSGPDSGGTQANGTMGGRQASVTLSRLLPTSGTGNQTFSLDFRTTPVAAARIVCVNYGSPWNNASNATCHP